MDQPRQQDDSSFEYNFGQGDAQFNPPSFSQPPPRSNRTGRIILLGFASIFLCILVCCCCIVVVGYSLREVVPAMFWVTMVNQDQLNDASTLNIVCPDSQAEQFTLQFQQTYPNAEISMDNRNEIEGSDNMAIIKGTLKADGVEFPYEAEFITDPDGPKFFVLFHCITEIRQISPPPPFETEDISDRLFGG